MKPASERQIDFANLINAATKIPLPQEKTAFAYWKYIQDNIEKYNTYRAEHFKNAKNFERGLRAKSKVMYGSYMDDEQDASWAAAMDFSWM